MNYSKLSTIEGKYTTGMRMFVVYSDGSKTKQLETVGKVGHLWVHLSSGNRIEIATGNVDGGNHLRAVIGRAYPSEGHYQELVELQKNWNVLRSQLGARVRLPDEVTLVHIRAASALLGMQIAN